MKKFRLLSMLLVVALAVAMFAGCGEKASDNQTDDPGNAIGGETPIDKTPENEPYNGEEYTPYGSFPEGLKAQKIGSADFESISTTGKEGIVYRAEDGKYGIMTFDGKKDTGAKYTSCTPSGNYFIVRTTEDDSIDDVTSLNCVGLVDVAGNEIVPMKYANISILGDRYVKASEVTEKAENKDEALVYYSNERFSFMADDDDTFFKGVWYIYDLEEGKILEGATGTNAYTCTEYGDFVRYVTDSEEQITVNHKGELLPENANLFANGYYTINEGEEGALYNSEGEKMFDYKKDGFVPKSSQDEYLIASKTIDSGYSYVLMNTDGEILSGEFEKGPVVYGDFVVVDKKIYNLEGESLFDGAVEYSYYEKQTGHAMFVKNGNDYTLIKSDGTVVYEVTADDVINVDPYTNASIKKKEDNKSVYYSFADKDFVIEGVAIAPWLVKVSKSNTEFDVVDTISGETIISGYKNYSHADVPGSVMYIYAEKADGGMDIYAVR